MAGLFDTEAGGLPPDGVCFNLYQEAAGNHGWRKCHHITEPFRKSIKARLDEGGGMDAWREALTIAAASDYLCGRVSDSRGKRFRMTLNFMLQPSSFEKILSGFYTREAEPPAPVYTPKPYVPPHMMHREPFVPEHPDVKDAALIISWRKVGRYDKANAVEERLAARQGRPPVLVPMPNEQPARPAPRMVFDVPVTAPACDEERARRLARVQLAEPPPYTDIPEADYETGEPD